MSLKASVIDRFFCNWRFVPVRIEAILIGGFLLTALGAGFSFGAPKPLDAGERSDRKSRSSEALQPPIGNPLGQANEQADEDLPETREERLIRQRRERMDRIEPWTAHPLERAIRRAEEAVEAATPTAEATLAHAFLGMTSNPLFAFPGVNYRDLLTLQAGRIRTNSGLSLGPRYRDPKFAGKDLDLEILAAASLRNYQYFNFRFGKMKLFPYSIFGPPPPEVQRQRTAFFSYLDVSYRHFPREEFFGLGNDTAKGARSDYSFRQASYDAVFGISHRKWLTLAGSASFFQPEVGAGGDPRFINAELAFSDDPAVDFDGQPDFFRLASTVLIDLRDRAGDPRRGFFAGVSATRFDPLRGNRYRFHRLQADARGYLPLGSEGRVLAVRLFASSDRTDGGASVPFYLQQTLGGPNTLRGFQNFRFRGEKLMHLSAEYRWEIHPTVESAAFYDTGRVYSAEEPIRIRHLKKSVGLALRFKSPDVVFFRVEVARSPEATRVQFIFGPSF